MVRVRRLIVLVLALVLVAPAAVSADAASRAPVITKLSRTSGGYAGGITVQIYGRNLNGVSRISFDGVNGINLQRISTKHLAIWTPALKAGVHKVRVVSNHGVSKPKLYRAINDGKAAVYGRITAAASGRPLHSDVYVYNPRTFGDRETHPLDNGWYRVTGLAPGKYAVCSIRPSADNAPGYSSACTQNFPVEDSAFAGLYYPTVTITSGRRIDFRHSVGGTIAGKLTDRATGRPLANVPVIAFGAAPPITGRWMKSASTNADGIFRVNGLAPGMYKVCFDVANGTAKSAGYLQTCDGDIFWTDGSAPTGGKSVKVAAGAVTKIGVHAIPRGGWLTGRVTAAHTGKPLADTAVEVSSSSWKLSISGDAIGNYPKTMLPAGRYQVCVWRYYQQTQRCYDNVTISVGRTTTVNATLDVGP